MALKEGNKAPNFKLEDKDGNVVDLSQIDSPYTVVYFYPRDNTPGCTTEGQEFTRLKKKFEALGVTVIGISGGTNKTKEKFCEKQGIGITLLSDSDFAVSSSYDSYGKKKFMGREYMGIMRNTFLLDSDKKVVKIFENVKPISHPQELIDFVKDL